MAFNLSYGDKGVDLSESGSNFKFYSKVPYAKEKPSKPKKPVVAKTTIEQTVKPVDKLISIINQRKRKI